MAWDLVSFALAWMSGGTWRHYKVILGCFTSLLDNIANHSDGVPRDEGMVGRELRRVPASLRLREKSNAEISGSANKAHDTTTM